MGKSPNEMGNCPFASLLDTPLVYETDAVKNYFLTLAGVQPKKRVFLENL
jgi:hypothetical protein